MNICLIVVDSLRADAVGTSGPRSTEFFRDLAGRTVVFRRAYATECWTLPAHMSMFTGLLPSEHQAHFKTMAYRGSAPTIAELLQGLGYSTEVVTRNSIFDGSLPGVNRGFGRSTLAVSNSSGLNPMSLLLALSKPRFRRQIEKSGFFHPRQRKSREFVSRFAQATVPADREALGVVLGRMRGLRRQGRPFFIFANLYDVHAPYSPTERSIFRSIDSLATLDEALRMSVVLPRLGGHAYLSPDFHISSRSRDLLYGRYRSAVDLMGCKLADFLRVIRDEGILEDTVLIVTSDHGEAFGDHDLYLHDSSVWQTHLHVPLYVHYPGAGTGAVDDVVSTRDLFGLMYAAATHTGSRGTILDPSYRSRHPIAVAEHFHSPRATTALPQFRQDLMTAICGDMKVVIRDGRSTYYDLSRDPAESEPDDAPLQEFAGMCRQFGAAREIIDEVMARLQTWTN